MDDSKDPIISLTVKAIMRDAKCDAHSDAADEAFKALSTIFTNTGTPILRHTAFAKLMKVQQDFVDFLFDEYRDTALELAERNSEVVEVRRELENAHKRLVTVHKERVVVHQAHANAIEEQHAEHQHLLETAIHGLRQIRVKEQTGPRALLREFLAIVTKFQPEDAEQKELQALATQLLVELQERLHEERKAIDRKYLEEIGRACEDPRWTAFVEAVGWPPGSNNAGDAEPCAEEQSA